jgi:hypothetical protein
MSITYAVLSNIGLHRTEAGMAQVINILLVDDIDGSEADDTIQFGLDGARYEIDLNLQHAQELRTLLAPYTGKARKITGSGRPAGPRTTAVNGSSNRKIRDWARARGLTVNDRGRIPADVIAKYETENSK